MKKNRLPLKKARIPLIICLKLALKNMWKKKFRYLVMFIICAISLTFLSITIELNGEILRQNVYTMIENGYQYTEIYNHMEASEEKLMESEYNKYLRSDLEPNSYDTIKSEIPGIILHEYGEVEINYAGLMQENANYFFTGYIKYLIKYDSTNTYNLICGRLPENNKEVLITDYLVAAFDYFNLYPNCSSIYDYLDLTLDLNIEKGYKIVGIVKTNYEKWSKFSNIESVEVSDKENYAYTNDMILMNSVILFEEQFNIEKVQTETTLSFNNQANGRVNSIGKWEVSVNTTVDNVLHEVTYAPNLSMGMTIDNLAIIERFRWRPSYGQSYYASYFGRNAQETGEIVIPTTWLDDLYDFNWSFNSSSDYYKRQEHDRFYNQIEGTKITIRFINRNNLDEFLEKEFTIVGVSAETKRAGGSSSAPACQISIKDFQEIYYFFTTEEEKIVVELPKDKDEALKLFNTAYKKGYIIDVFAYQSDIEAYEVDPFIDLASKAGLFIFAAFTMGIMWTIISIEIVDSKKEIGILRSIGLSGAKVSLIFIIQTASMIILSYFLGVYASYKLIPYFNMGITDEYGKIILSMYAFTYRTPLYLGIFVIVMTFISTFIPLFKIMSQKIIDVINEREV